MMDTNPFVAPKNYSQMLLKIALFTFLCALCFAWLAAHTSPVAKEFLGVFRIHISTFGLDIPFGYFLVAFLVAFAFRVAKLHDRISDLFGIRKRFDVQEILTPLAAGVGIPVTLETRERLESKRDEAMRRVFYKYASSTKPQIDDHVIIMALDKWSWFWILIESIGVSFLALLVLLALGAYFGAAIAATWAFLATVVASFANRACVSLAHVQVQTILENTVWQTEIRAVLSAL